MLCDDVANMDGREVVLAAKRINPRTGVIVLSGYAGMLTELMKNRQAFPFDHFISKADLRSKEDMISIANRLVRKDKNTQQVTPPDKE